jgi:hypothetical protein
MNQLAKDLEFFRTQFSTSLKYDNGTEPDIADREEETIDLRPYMDTANGTITPETVITDYSGKRCYE